MAGPAINAPRISFTPHECRCLATAFEFVARQAREAGVPDVARECDAAAIVAWNIDHDAFSQFTAVQSRSLMIGLRKLGAYDEGPLREEWGRLYLKLSAILRTAREFSAN